MKNLPWSATDDDIYAFFDGLPIYQVRLAIDHDGRPKGFGHIEFETVEGAAAAIAKSGEYIGDRDVYIETTTERQQRTFWLSRFLSVCVPPGHHHHHHHHHWWRIEHVLPRVLLLCVGYRAFALANAHNWYIARQKHHTMRTPVAGFCLLGGPNADSILVGMRRRRDYPFGPTQRMSSPSTFVIDD
jgi:hypothetical protein